MLHCGSERASPSASVAVPVKVIAEQTPWFEDVGVSVTVGGVFTLNVNCRDPLPIESVTVRLGE